jgi:hypothetical protein
MICVLSCFPYAQHEWLFLSVHLLSSLSLTRHPHDSSQERAEDKQDGQGASILRRGDVLSHLCAAGLTKVEAGLLLVHVEILGGGTVFESSDASGDAVRAARIEQTGRGRDSIAGECRQGELNCSVMNGQIFLTDCILDNILSRLPLASLGRLACMCKAFDGVMRASVFGFVFQRHAPWCVLRRTAGICDCASGTARTPHRARSQPTLPLPTCTRLTSTHIHTSSTAAALAFRRGWYRGFGASFSWREPASAAA